MRVVLAIFLILHGIAHLVGFLTPWGLLPTPATLPAPASAPDALFGGRVILDRSVARGLGVIWLVVGLSMVVAAIGLWRREPWAPGAVVLSILVSLAICFAWWPATRIGVVVNVAILIALLTVGYFAYRTAMRFERQRALSGSAIVETAFGPVEYASLGEGPPILVIHGTGGGWDQGIYAARSIVPFGYRLIAPSRFGYLRTPLPADASPQHEADVLASLLDSLDIDRVAVMSFSAGTAPAVQLALRHPERVSSLVLFVPAAAGTSPPPAKGPPRFVTNVVLRYDFPMWVAIQLAPNTMYRVAAVPPRLVKTLSDRDRAVLEEGIRIILPVSARFRGIVNDAKTQSGDEPLYPLDRVDAPALILSAEDDLYQTLSVARRMAAQMPKARLLEYRTGGHFLIGRSAEVWPEVAGFLRSHSAVETAVSRAVPVPPRRGERRYG